MVDRASGRVVAIVSHEKGGQHGHAVELSVLDLLPDLTSNQVQELKRVRQLAADEPPLALDDYGSDDLYAGIVHMLDHEQQLEPLLEAVKRVEGGSQADRACFLVPARDSDSPDSLAEHLIVVSDEKRLREQAQQPRLALYIRAPDTHDEDPGNWFWPALIDAVMPCMLFSGGQRKLADKKD